MIIIPIAGGGEAMAETEERLRLTPQRRAILAAVRASRAHPTADEVYRRVRRSLPRISLGTVYRNLVLLAEMGLIDRITAGNGPMRFDALLKEHAHLRCLQCGRLDDAPARRPKAAPKELAGYRITGCRMEYVGYCPKCRAREERGEEAGD